LTHILYMTLKAGLDCKVNIQVVNSLYTMDVSTRLNYHPLASEKASAIHRTIYVPQGKIETVFYEQLSKIQVLYFLVPSFICHVMCLKPLIEKCVITKHRTSVPCNLHRSQIQVKQSYEVCVNKIKNKSFVT